LVKLGRRGRNEASHRGVAISAIVLILLALAPLGSLAGRADALCAQTHWGECDYSWGYSNPNNLGWLVPSNTTIFTPLHTNASVSGWMQAEVTLFPYNVSSFTAMDLGLYINGELVASATSQNLSITGAGGYDGVCTGGQCVGGYGGDCSGGVCGTQLLKSVTPDLAIFSNWNWEVGIYHTFGLSGFPSGSTLAMAFETSKPVWVSIDNQSFGFSYVEANPSFTSLPATSPQYNSKSPYTMAVWAYSPNPNAPGGPVVSSWFPPVLIVFSFLLLIIAITVFVVARSVKVKKQSSVQSQSSAFLIRTDRPWHWRSAYLD
jgi:hypothetical protein